jgi:hypothetical protein
VLALDASSPYISGVLGRTMFASKMKPGLNSMGVAAHAHFHFTEPVTTIVRVRSVPDAHTLVYVSLCVHASCADK